MNRKQNPHHSDEDADNAAWNVPAGAEVHEVSSAGGDRQLAVGLSLPNYELLGVPTDEPAFQARDLGIFREDEESSVQGQDLKKDLEDDLALD